MESSVSLSKTHRVRVGNLTLGGGSPIRVQSMTNTDTGDVSATVAQILELARSGSELVRITVKDERQADAVPEIVSQCREQQCEVPIIGDFHFNGHLLLSKNSACAQALDKYRINPGNVGFGKHRDENFEQFIGLACDYDKPIRIGVNGGSLDPKLVAKNMDENQKLTVPKTTEDVILATMVQSALESASLAESLGLEKNKIILSTKMSDVPSVVAVYRELSQRCRYPLHVGLTEAGMGRKGIVSSSCALAILLSEGIGDTIRVSLTPAPGGARTEEVKVCQDILQSLGLRSFHPTVTACPGCGRTTSTLFQELSLFVEQFLEERLPVWQEEGRVGVQGLKVAVMGCVVNGPGEAKGADIGISLPGTGESPAAPVYADGKKIATLRGRYEVLARDFSELIENYVAQHYPCS